MKKIPTVYISKEVKTNTRYKEVYTGLKEKMAHGYTLEELENTKSNIWCRDYLPVKDGKGIYHQFNYDPIYINGSKEENSKPDPRILNQSLGIEDIRYHLDVTLDGGAIEVFGDSAIISSRVFTENGISFDSKNEQEFITNLKDILSLKRLVVVPEHPYDFTGHVDGLVRFIDANTVCINELHAEMDGFEKFNPQKKKLMLAWYYGFKMCLLNAGFTINELPYVPDEGSSMSAKGIYLNFLLLPDLILMPGFVQEADQKDGEKTGQNNDEVAAERLAKLYGRRVVIIPATELAKKGGIINCITWSAS